MTGARRAAVPPPRRPWSGASGRAAAGSVGGRPWELRTGPAGVVAVTPTGTVAGADVSERHGRLVVEFWAQGPDLPSELSARLVAQVFALPVVGSHRPVLVSVPRRGGNLLVHARRYVQDARTHAAGATCMVEGRLGEHPPVAAGPAAARR